MIGVSTARNPRWSSFDQGRIAPDFLVVAFSEPLPVPASAKTL
jgi:hypothetical protein